VAVAALLLVGVGPATTAQASSQSPQPERYSHQAVTATNAQRASRGLRTLRTNRCLEHAATRQAMRMADRQEMFHQDLHAVLVGCHLDSAGENVAVGFRTGRSVVDDGWMHSAGHRANLLNPSFALLGIGAARGPDGRWYVSQVLGRSA
jgi:uncharacterized protein YkwD